MLENLIWKNVFLPNFVKKEIVSFYESHYNNSNITFRHKTFKSNLIHYLCHKIHRKWFHNYKNKPNHLFEDIYKYLTSIEIPMSFWLLLSKTNKVHKLQKLLEWGFNLHKSFKIKNIEMNLAQQALWAYNQKLISFEEIKEILEVLIKENVNLFETSYQISQYEKATQLIKDENISHEILLVKNKQLIDILFGWIDKDIYSYLIQSQIPENNKILLEFLYLKQKVHNVYIENFSGNMRRTGDSNLYKYISSIEEVIKRQYIFLSQSAIYNSLSLLFNLPEFSDKLSNNAILKCYESFNKLNSTAKRFLLADLVSKNKDIVLFNLLASKKINLNWTIKTEEGSNILGLELLNNLEFIEHILSDENFKVNIVNKVGNNILHLLGELPLEEDLTKEKLKKKIQTLNELEKTFLLNQYNQENLTPMLKAIKEENVSMIEFLLELGVSAIEEISGIDKDYASPINYLTRKIEIVEFVSDICEKLNIQGNEKDNWMYEFHKKWTIEKNYYKMQKKLSDFRKKEKVQKI